MSKFFSLCLSLALFSNVAVAQDNFYDALQGFESLEDFLPKDEFGSLVVKENKNRRLQKDIVPLIVDKIPEAAAYNIHNPEQVFCYHIAKRPKGYTGYTIGNYQVVDYCGELDFDVLTTTYEPLFTRSPNIITTVSKCVIEPKIMLRFVRGVDYTDVLLSSPCPSFTVFYGGKYNSFNIKQGIIDDVINQFDKNRETFHSPALISKTVANAVASTEDESYQLEKKQKENERKYKVIEKKEETKEKKGGWNNLKLKM
jgi:hypothetical protein